MKTKAFSLFFFLLFLLTGCTQEHLIFLKNIRQANIISLDKILEEAGLKPPDSKREPIDYERMAREQQPREVIRERTPPPTPSSHITLNIPAGEEFSFRVTDDKNTFVVLKSIEGDTSYNAVSSDVSSAFYSFTAGDRNGALKFDVFDLGGNIQKHITYFIRISAPRKPPDKDDKPVEVVEIQPGVSKPDVTKPAVSDISPLAKSVIASLAGMGYRNKVKTLYENIDSPDISVNDREILRDKLIDLLIENKNFREAAENIDALADINRRYLHSGRLEKARNRFRDAMRHYTLALNGSGDTKKSAIMELGEMMINEGNVDRNVIDMLVGHSENFKEDEPDFYARSMINIGRLKQFTADIYEARDIFQSIIQGGYSMEIRNLAEKYYDELVKNFLEYR
jgi:tetratricopeptide (TPR) repeat protein